MHLSTPNQVHAYMNIYRNHENLCGFHEDNQDSPNGNGAGGCSTIVQLNSGKENLNH